MTTTTRDWFLDRWALLFGRNMFGEPNDRPGLGVLARQYGYPPFSVFNARGGEPKARKDAWLARGIEGELGRDGGLAFTGTPLGGWMLEHGDGAHRMTTETSAFDPALTESHLRWFCPRGGQVIDPFAGGSVRGIIAGYYGYRYWGCDLSARQIAANEGQADAILDAEATRPVWVVGDCVDKLAEAPEADFLLTCPPYGNLEHYSDDPRDLSAMGWIAYRETLRLVVKRSVARLRQNRFACVVVGNFRKRDGFYRDLVGETVRAFADEGVGYYNDEVLVTALGTASARADAQFEHSRKLVKVHQNVLTFCKGDPVIAADVVKGEL